MITFWDALLVIWVVLGFFIGMAVFGSLLGRKLEGMHGIDMLAIACAFFMAWPFMIWILYAKDGWGDIDDDG